MNERPNHLNNSHDQSPNTDISPSEIDAFDANLNELSDGDRFPNSWSGSRHERPHDRPELSDASLLSESLASYAGGFQEQVDVAHESRFEASEPRPELWETIMLANSGPASGSVTTTASWSDPLPSPPPQQSNPIRSSVRRAPRWSIFANIALVLAILIAGYEVWNNRGGGGDGDNGVAWQPQTPANEISAISSPEATPDAATCPPPPTNEGDVHEFTDWEGVVTDIENCQVLFDWPAGFEPNIDKIRDRFPDDDSRSQRGAGMLMLSGFNQCAWTVTWFLAREVGDTSLQDEAWQHITAGYPFDVDRSVTEYQSSVIEAAQRGDFTMLERQAASCYPLGWTDFSGTPALLQDAADTSESAATPATADQPCDLSGDVAIYAGGGRPTGSQLALWLNENHELMLNCEAAPDGVVLVTGVTGMMPTATEGFVYLDLEQKQIDRLRGAIFNIAAGQMLEVGLPQDESTYQFVVSAGSPWLIAPSAENPDDWQFTDLRTMTSKSVSEITGIAASSDDSVVTSITGATSVVIVSRSDGSIQAFVVNESLDSAKSLDLSIAVSGAWLSPNGQVLAIQSGDHGDPGQAEISYSLIDVNDGSLIAESSPADIYYPGVTWLADSSGVVYVTDASLIRLSATPGEGETTLLQAQPEGSLRNFQATDDAEVVLVTEDVPQDDNGVATVDRSPAIHAVNVVTGENVTHEGIDVSAQSWNLQIPDRFLVMSPTYPKADEINTYQVVDAITGAVLGEIADAPTGSGPDTVGRSADGSVEVIAFDSLNVYLIRTDGTTTIITKLVPPDSDLAASGVGAGVEVSPSGESMTLFFGNPNEPMEFWTTSLVGDFDPWTQNLTEDGDLGGYVTWISLTGD